MVARKNNLLERVRATFARRKGITEKRMFGGHCFFANGNMIGGVTGDDELIIRVGPEAYSSALQRPYAREMNFTGRTMRGFVLVDQPGIETDEELRFWLDWGVHYARSLSAK